jgi:hypothetical protein
VSCALESDLNPSITGHGRVREPKALAYAAIRFSVQSSGPRGTNPNLSVTSSLIPEKHDSGRDAYKDRAGASYFRLEHSLSPRMSSFVDRGADYNAFGRDPDGRLAYLAAAFWGPSYVPPFPSQVFGGPPEPPRYGPPAAYQHRCLPPSWAPSPPPGPPPQPPYLDPPPYFDAGLFDAFRFGSNYVAEHQGALPYGKRPH